MLLMKITTCLKILNYIFFVAFSSDSRYLFEGHLTVQPEPAPPAWLVAQNLLRTLAVAQDWASVLTTSESQEESSNATETSRRVQVPESVRELINNMQEMGDFLNLDNVIEASLQVSFSIFIVDLFFEKDRIFFSQKLKLPLNCFLSICKKYYICFSRNRSFLTLIMESCK